MQCTENPLFTVVPLLSVHVTLMVSCDFPVCFSAATARGSRPGKGTIGSRVCDWPAGWAAPAGACVTMEGPPGRRSPSLRERDWLCVNFLKVLRLEIHRFRLGHKGTVIPEGALLCLWCVCVCLLCFPASPLSHVRSKRLLKCLSHEPGDWRMRQSGIILCTPPTKCMTY